MTDYKRVALFFAPEQNSELASFGASWLGWDVEAGQAVAHPNIVGLPRSISELSATPRKYGFHGTLKAPFRLKESYDVSELCKSAHAFATHQKRFSIGQMKVAKIGQFIAIIPGKQNKDLTEFATHVVQEFEDFRAPLSDRDIAKRRQAQLTANQDKLMLKWGYPYIFDEFKFHLTLTGSLDETEAKSVETVLSEHLSDILKDPVQVVDLCLYGERKDGMFEIIERFPLTG